MTKKFEYASNTPRESRFPSGRQRRYWQEVMRPVWNTSWALEGVVTGENWASPDLRAESKSLQMFPRLVLACLIL